MLHLLDLVRDADDAQSLPAKKNILSRNPSPQAVRQLRSQAAKQSLSGSHAIPLSPLFDSRNDLVDKIPRIGETLGARGISQPLQCVSVSNNEGVDEISAQRPLQQNISRGMQLAAGEQPYHDAFRKSHSSRKQEATLCLATSHPIPTFTHLHTLFLLPFLPFCLSAFLPHYTHRPMAYGNQQSDNCNLATAVAKPSMQTVHADRPCRPVSATHPDSF